VSAPSSRPPRDWIRCNTKTDNQPGWGDQRSMGSARPPGPVRAQRVWWVPAGCPPRHKLTRSARARACWDLGSPPQFASFLCPQRWGAKQA
jgi:hypothetical protein